MQKLVACVVVFAVACGGDETSGLQNKAPIARAGNDISSEPGLQIRFDGGASSDPDGDVVAWVWDFGDGSTGDGKVAIHTFEAEGTYTAKLTVTDDEGATASDTLTVTLVKNEPPNEPPVAVIGALSEVEGGTEVTFDAADSTDSDGSIVAWSWTFGTEGTADTETAKHTFADPGDYTITLTVTDDDGATDTAEVTLTVKEKPPVVVTLPSPSQWTWNLVTPSNPPSCGDFSVGPLTIKVNGTQMTITEKALGLFDVNYTGSYTPTTRAFSCTNSGFGSTATIAGTFAADFKRFDGSYTISTGGCSDSEPIFGTRTSPP